jgi:hypothetical protein
VSQNFSLNQVCSQWRQGVEILFCRNLEIRRAAIDTFKKVTRSFHEYVIMWENFSEIYSDGTSSMLSYRIWFIILNKNWLQMQLVYCGI